MTDHPVVVLLIEDNPGDARLVAEFLAEATDLRYTLRQANRLSEGLDRLSPGDVDLVLLDLNLPDSQGLETLLAVRSAGPRIPVVVLTTLDEEAGPAALRSGAQDYLPKGKFDTELLMRTIRYAIERQLLLNELEQRHRKEQHARKLELLEALTGSTDTALGTHLFGARSLREASADLFTKIVHRYGDALAAAVASGSDELPPEATAEIDRIAGGLAALHASPRDALDVHAATMTVKERLLPPEEIGRYLEQGRQALLELISQLASHYRTYQVTARDTSS
jgi:CheY-like chemotaxis protein